MFSATFPRKVQKIGHQFLREKFVFVAVGMVGGANCDISQQFVDVTGPSALSKRDLLAGLLNEDAVNGIHRCFKIMYILSDVYVLFTLDKKTLIFVETRKQAKYLSKGLNADFKATGIHG